MRALRGISWNLRCAVRSLARARGYTTVSILLLAMGIGVNTSAFSLINAVLFAPLPVRDSTELLFIYPVNSEIVDSGIDQYQAATGKPDLFAGVAATRRTTTNVARGVDVERVLGELVSGSYFDTLG